MKENIENLRKGLEEIKNIDSNGSSYWIASELMLFLDYKNIIEFTPIIQKAQIACLNSGQQIEDHFFNVNNGEDWELSRYACYLIALNGNPEKIQIAVAQSYFAVQTRKQEISEGITKYVSESEKRLYIRNEVLDHNKKLAATAKHAGVRNFGFFNDSGYHGLYGMKSEELAVYKGIKQSELLDRAGSTELAANLFRITQTDEKIKKDKIKGEMEASRTHWIVGDKIRQTIRQIGGELPENLKPEEHIKNIRKEAKKLPPKSQKRLI